MALGLGVIILITGAHLLFGINARERRQSMFDGDARVPSSHLSLVKEASVVTKEPRSQTTSLKSGTMELLVTSIMPHGVALDQSHPSGFCDPQRKFRASEIAAVMNTSAGRELLKAHTKYSGFTEFAKKFARDDGTVIVTAAGYTYRTSLMNWLHALWAVDITNYAIVALDGRLQTFLAERGVPSYFGNGELESAGAAFGLPATHRLGLVWVYRYLLIRALLKAKLSVLQLDADAIVLRDPFPILDAVPGDVVAQRGTFPFKLGKTWGAALVFGLILYRPTPAALSWFELSLAKFVEHKDDQVAMQYAADVCSRMVPHRFIPVLGEDSKIAFPNPKEDTIWPSRKDLYLENRPAPIGKLQSQRESYHRLVSEFPIDASGHHLRLGLLSFAAFPRKCGRDNDFPERKPECVVAHCASPKSGSDKQRAMRRFQLNFLRDGWVDVPIPADGSASNYLSAIGNHRHPAIAKPNEARHKPRAPR